MSIETVSKYLRRFGREQDILIPEVSTATVQLAAKALGTSPAHIAKSICVYDQSGEHAILVVASGDVRLDNRKFKECFGFKPRMLKSDDVERLTSHAPGGVCPFALPNSAHVYLDDSLRRLDHVYPACGSANSVIRLTLPELEKYSLALGWVDVTKLSE